MVLGALVIVIVGILVVNYFKDKQGQTLTGLNTQNQNGKEHVVTKGETLWSIAEDEFGSGYNWTDIYNSNGLKSQTIEVGQKLTIPQIAPKQPTATKTATTIESSSQTIAGDSYTVVQGDSLWKIAVRAYGDGYKWVEIAKANKLAHPDLIHAGNVLSLPR